MAMNNEPVAWRTHYPSGWEYKDGNPPFELKGNSQLLYTHPAKTLTDEEIIDIIERLIADWKDDFKNYKYNSDEPEENKLRDDVFAILRKAQENELLKKLAVPDEARQKLHELQVKQCGDSYDTVCPPSVCDCRKAQEK